MSLQALLNNGDELLAVSGHGSAVLDVACSPESSWIATGGPDGTVRTWDLTNGDELLRLSGHRSYVQSVSINSLGTEIVSASADATVRPRRATGAPSAIDLPGASLIDLALKLPADPSSGCGRSLPWRLPLVEDWQSVCRQCWSDL